MRSPPQDKISKRIHVDYMVDRSNVKDEQSFKLIDTNTSIFDRKYLLLCK